MELEFDQDVGKFVTISYRGVDGTPKRALGILREVTANGLLVIVNMKEPSRYKIVNPSEVTIVDYVAEPVEVKE